MRPSAWLAVALLCGLAGIAQGHAASGALPDAAAYLIMADGKTLWSKEADKRLPPASLTKLMTALLVMEAKDTGRIVMVGKAAANETGTRLGLRAGDRMKVEDLLAAALIQSANDACHALADHVAGDQARFVALMNARTQTWGLANTHFENACGHDQPAHYASARDLAALAERALAQPMIARLVALPAYDVRTTDGHRRFHLRNKNYLIGHYPGAIGVKTGYTRQAGKCLIAAARQDGHNVLLVMLNARNRWWDALDTLERVFADLQYAS